MKSAATSICFAAALAVLGYVLPLMFPTISPSVQYALFGFAIFLLILGGALWLLRTPPEAAPTPSSNISQSHSGTGHNIVAGTVNVGAQRFDWNEGLLNEIAASLDPTREVAIAWRNKGRGSTLATTLKEFLIGKGFRIGGEMGIGEITGVEFERPITISRDGFNFGGVTVFGGCQAVAIEPEAGR
jgi:hypothetical protein